MSRPAKPARLKSRDPGSFKGLLIRMNLEGWRSLRILAAEIDTTRLAGIERTCCGPPVTSEDNPICDVTQYFADAVILDKFVTIARSQL